MGEFFRQFKIPLVVGELFAGIILGPTILGKYYPEISSFFFSTEGNVPLAINGLTSLSVIMLLFVAGMEVDLSIIRKQGSTAIKTSILGLILPFILGYFIAYYFTPLFGNNNYADKNVFSLFIGTAMAVSALPIIARTLMDLGIFKTRIG